MLAGGPAEAGGPLPAQPPSASVDTKAADGRRANMRPGAART